MCFASALPSSLIVIIAAISKMQVGSQVQVKWHTPIADAKLQLSKNRSNVPKNRVSWEVGIVKTIADNRVEVEWPGKKVSDHKISEIHPYEFTERPTPKATRYSATVFFEKKAPKRKREGQ